MSGHFSYGNHHKMEKKDLFIEQLIRVNQAGEYGAKRIYQGQIDYNKDENELKNLEHMAAQEDEHLKYFNNLMIENAVRPTFLHPLWHIGGYAMGALSSKIDARLAHAVTIAVEEVIDQHYQEQLEQLEFYPQHRSLAQSIEKFRQEEIQHAKIATDKGGNDHPASSIVKTLTKAVTQMAISLSKRI